MEIRHKQLRLISFCISFLLIILTSIAYSQKNVKNDPEFNCKKTQQLSFNAIASTFPLNKTVKILLVSFPWTAKSLDESAENVIDSLPRIGTKLDYQSLKEVRVLTFPQIVELVDILYNVNFNPKKASISRSAACYEPRNAIVFLDSDDNIVEFIEICFTCEDYHTLHHTYFGEFCIGKFQMLSDFFVSAGMNYHLKK